MQEVGAIIVASVLAVAVMTVTLAFAAFAMQYGWNLFAPELFGLPTATAYNALGVAVVMLTAKMFFGGAK